MSTFTKSAKNKRKLTLLTTLGIISEYESNHVIRCCITDIGAIIWLPHFSSGNPEK